MNLSSLKMGLRLQLGFGLVLGLLAIGLATGISRMEALDSAFTQLAEHRVPNMEAAEDWQRYLQDSGLKMRNMLLLDNPQEIHKQMAFVREDQAKRTKVVTDLTQSIVLAEGKAKLQVALTARETYAPLEQKYLALIEAGNMVEAKRLLLQEVRPAQIANIDAIGALVEFEKAAVTASAQTASQNYRFGRTLLLIIGGVALVVGVLASIMITRSVLNQLGGEPTDAAHIAGKIAQGHLDIPTNAIAGDKDSVMAAMHTMRLHLTEIVTNVRQRAAQVVEGTRQISSGNSDLSQRTQEQASALEETASSMEQMTATVKQNADNARQANQVAANARQQAEHGGKVVGDAIAAMSEINASSRKIADIIGVIDEIAFQTNLLALNAAVEAARAGEQGRGFAVVATEVRNLAQRSATAAKEIKTLINDSVAKVKVGSDLVDASGATLTEIVTSVKKVTDIVGEIAAASNEQSAGLEQINLAVAQMDSVTQQNAALVEEAAAASKAIEDQAEALADEIAYFRIESSGTLSSSTASVTEKATLRRAAVSSNTPANRIRTASTPHVVALSKASGDDWQSF